MIKPIKKLLLITLLIPALATRKSELQDQNNLSKENLSDDSRPRTEHIAEQKTPEQPGLLNKNHLNEDLKEEKSSRGDEQKSSERPSEDSNEDEDTTYRISKEITTENINHVNHNHRPSELIEQELKNLIQDKEIVEDMKLNRLDQPTTIVDQSHINHDHRPSQLIEQERKYERDMKHDENNQPDRLDEQKTSKFKSKSRNPSPTHIEEQNVVNDRHFNKGKRPGQHKHTTVTIEKSFGYMAAVLKGTTYLNAGALIDENWVLTAAKGIHLMRETTRFLRIRLGSINFKKGGTLLNVKYLEIHPYFKSSKPTYDLALVMLSKPVRFTATLSSIRLLSKPKLVPSTHFIMTSWPSIIEQITNKSLSTGVIKHHRILSVTHLHPSDPEECFEELEEIGAGHEGAMCLETGVDDDCLRDTGAPIVINGILWGIISSWRPEECDEENSSIFASLVSASNSSSWIHSVVHGYKLRPKKS